MPKYADISKTATDLLTEDYSTKTTLKIKTKAACVGVTNETERKSDDSDSVSLLSKITLKWASPSGYLSVDKLALAPNGSFGLETSLSNLAPNLKFTFVGSNKLDGTAGIEYKYNNLFATTNLDVVDFKSIASTVNLSLNKANVGGSMNYKFKGGLDKLSVGANYSTGPLFLSAFSSMDKDGTLIKDLQVNTLYKVSNELTLGTQSSHSASSPISNMSAGMAFTGVKNNNIKGKVTQKGVINLACVHSGVGKGVSIAPNVEVCVKDLSTFKWGVGVTIG